MKGARNRSHKLVCFLILIIFIMFLFIGCSANVETKPDDSDNEILSDTAVNENYQLEPVYDSELASIIDDINMDEEEMKLFNSPIDYKPLEKTTFDNLHSAFEDGEISEEEHSKYLIIQAFQPELLPEKYLGAEGLESINYAYQYIADNWDDLDENTKELLEPYLVPISDPKSYYYINDYENEITLRQPKKNKKDTIIKTVNAAEATKVLIENFFYIDNQKFTIEYYEYNNWGEDEKLDYNMCIQDIEEAIFHSYEKFEQLLTISLTQPVRIELVPLPETKTTITNGLAWSQNGTYRIRLATANYNNPIKTQAVSAHELFHNFQFEMGLGRKGVKKDERWLMEATAKWSENYAFEEYNTEHDSYLKYFYKTLDRDRINFGNSFEYAGYMLFYYFSDYGRYDLVPEILWGTAREGESFIRKYLSDEVADMKEQYADYAFINVNFGIAKEYYDYGDLAGNPNGKALYRKALMGVNEDDVEVSLKPGALKYHYYVFDTSDEIQHVEFYFDRDFADDKYIKRQAMIKIDDEWHLEDWSYIDEVKYCRLREMKNENIQHIIIIYSNSNFKKTGTDNPIDNFEVKTEKCPSEMDITIEAEYKYINDDFVWTANATLEDTVKITDHTFYISKNCKYNMEGSGVLEGETLMDSTGSYSSSVNDPSIGDSIVRIIKPMDEELEDISQELRDYGLDENTPAGGILVTIPSIGEGESLSGNTTLYLPDPVGEMSIDGPLPFDGLNQAIAVELNADDWDSNGFSTEMTLDYFSHKPAILDWFSVDFGQLQNSLGSINSGSDTDMGEINDILEGSGISMEDLEGMKGMEGLEDMVPSSGPGEDSSLSKSLDAITGMLIPSSSKVEGISGTIKLKIRGRYTKFN